MSIILLLFSSICFAQEKKVETIIDYGLHKKNLQGKEQEPYDSLLNFIKNKSDSLLKRKFGQVFFEKSMIHNTRRSYYYG